MAEKTKHYAEHKLSQILPMMSEEDLQELADDIRENGLRAPITLLDGKVLDGRNRLRACRMAGVEPKFRDFNGDGDPLSFIISANVRRRHLTEGQRAMIAAKLAKMKHGGDQRANLPFGAKTMQDAADELNVSRRSVVTAKQVLREGTPETVAAVERGEKSLNAAAAEIKAKTEREEEALDRTGYPIPDAILDEWRRAEGVARSILHRISELRVEVKKALDDADPIFVEITNTSTADLNNAYGSLKRVRPYAVCTSCQGHARKRCTLCKGRGFISEFAYQSFVPKETKEVRARLAAERKGAKA